MDFVDFNLAKKLKEKGFTIRTKDIIAMYNELGVFHTLTTSADYETCASGFKCRCYYDYDDFDEHDFIAPTISQVLKWLRKEKKYHVYAAYGAVSKFRYVIIQLDNEDAKYTIKRHFKTYEDAIMAGINYVINNII